MSIFAVDVAHNELNNTFTVNKPQKLRLQIRRKQNDERFKMIRRQFVDSLKSLNFLEQLKSQKDNLTAKKINWLVDGLQRGQNTASFYQDMIDMQLQPYLCEVMLNQQISIQNKTKILQSLVQLTYYSHKIPKQFLENNMIDYFRCQLQKFHIKDEIQQNFIHYLSKLILNLTSFKNIEFNQHMMEYDLLKMFHDAVQCQIWGAEFRAELRKTLLKIYSNIFLSGPRSMKLVMETLYRILSQKRNYEDEEIFCCMLRCLVEAAKINGFWVYLQSRTAQNGEIYSQILTIVDTINKHFAPASFGYFLDFMNALYDQQQSQITQQLQNYYPQLPPNFFLTSLKKLSQPTPQSPSSQSPSSLTPSACSKRTICKLLKLLSYIPCLQGTIYNTSLQKSQLVQIILQKYIMQNLVSRKYLIKVLIKLLDQDNCILDVLIDNGIFDVVRELVSSDFQKDEKIDVIQLVEKLIQAEEELRDKTKGENKILNVFYDRGIVRDIEKMQDDHNQEVYRRAEQFMARISQFSQKN